MVLHGLRLAQPIVIGPSSGDGRRLHHIYLTLKHVDLSLLKLLLLLLMELVRSQILQQGEVMIGQGKLLGRSRRGIALILQIGRHGEVRGRTRLGAKACREVSQNLMVHQLILDLKLLDLLREAARTAAGTRRLAHSGLALSAGGHRVTGVAIGRDHYDVRARTGALLCWQVT